MCCFYNLFFYLLPYLNSKVGAYEKTKRNNKTKKKTSLRIAFKGYFNNYSQIQNLSDLHFLFYTKKHAFKEKHFK